MRGIYIMNTAIPSRNANGVHVMKMCEAFVQNGIEVELILPGLRDTRTVPEEELFSRYGIKNPFKITRIHMRESCVTGVRCWLFSFLALLLSVYRKPDFVYTRVPEAAILSVFFHRPIALEVHSRLDGRFKTWRTAEKKWLRPIIVISAPLREMLVKEHHTDAGKITVLSDGVSLGSYQETGPLFSKDSLRIVYIGSILRGKGVDTVLKIAQLDESGNQYHIYGGSEDQLRELRKMAKSGRGNVVLHGYIENSKVPEVLKKFDITLLPNKAEMEGGIGAFTSPLKMFEYMAAGRILIASDLPILREVLSEKNCFFADPDKAEDWIRVLRYISANREEAKRRAKQAGEDSITYSWKKRAAAILSLLQVLPARE